ncbi:MAG: serine hydrolase [Candidatus Daviesbacteria bacterium]|nr:serine hydrolase [Candidatus Daviesbacteria bacterium]
MKFKTKFFIIILLFLAGAFVIYHFSKEESVFSFDFSAKQNKNDPELERIVSTNLNGTKGKFAVYIEELEATHSAKRTPENPRKYVLNEKESFPTASLYKLVLLAVAMKEIESGGLKLEDTISGSKSNLTAKFGSVDFGYEDFPENFEFSVEEILERIGRISDNFAAIMLTEKLRESSDPLLSMARELGMVNTSFNSATAEPNTTASDIALFFKKLYLGEVVSKSASAKIMEILALSNINDRIPANLGDDVQVIHKTGELSKVRHDAGLIFPPYNPNYPSNPYLIVLLSKDLEFEDEGIETLAKISKGVWDYFQGK